MKYVLLILALVFGAVFITRAPLPMWWKVAAEIVYIVGFWGVVAWRAKHSEHL